MSKLIFRTYRQHVQDERAVRCLDLNDRMCIKGISDAKKGLEDFERYGDRGVP